LKTERVAVHDAGVNTLQVKRMAMVCVRVEELDENEVVARGLADFGYESPHGLFDKHQNDAQAA